jgi:hypothetical protein
MIAYMIMHALKRGTFLSIQAPTMYRIASSSNYIAKRREALVPKSEGLDFGARAC